MRNWNENCEKRSHKMDRNPAETERKIGTCHSFITQPSIIKDHLPNMDIKTFCILEKEWIYDDLTAHICSICLSKNHELCQLFLQITLNRKRILRNDSFSEIPNLLPYFPTLFIFMHHINHYILLLLMHFCKPTQKRRQNTKVEIMAIDRNLLEYAIIIQFELTGNKLVFHPWL